MSDHICINIEKIEYEINTCDQEQSTKHNRWVPVLKICIQAEYENYNDEPSPEIKKSPHPHHFNRIRGHALHCRIRPEQQPDAI